jgi:hypothetical protein
MDYVRQSALRYLTPDYDYGYGIPNLGLALNIGLSLQDEKNSEIKIFPNPVDQYLNIKVSDNIEDSILTIYNVLGKVVLKQKITKSINSVDVSSISSGLYMLRIQSKHASKTFKFIKS